MTQADNIKTHWAAATKVAQSVMVPAFALWAVAQAGAESLWGTAGVVTSGATNNPFGMKAGSWITGYAKDGKTPIVKAGKAIAGPYLEKATNTKYYYRKFPTLEEAYYDLWDLFSRRLKAYSDHIDLLKKGNYEAWALAILPTYDPTNSNYPKLIQQRMTTVKKTLGLK
jgi:flagellum-specific peptidoglycan hydrolase FlgJ